MYHQSMKNHVRMERISEHPAVDNSDPAAIQHLLQLYQEIGTHFNETREIMTCSSVKQGLFLFSRQLDLQSR